MSNILRRFWESPIFPTYATSIAFTAQTAQQAAITHHGIMPNNPNLVPILVNLFLQQFIIVTTNNPPTIDALAFVDAMGEIFRTLKLDFQFKVLNFFCSLPPSLGRRMKPSKCSTGGFSS
jgi:hypothetical protein